MVCSTVQSDSNPAPSAACANAMASFGSTYRPVLQNHNPNFIATHSHDSLNITTLPHLFVAVPEPAHPAGQGRIAAAQRRTLDGPSRAPVTLALKELKATRVGEEPTGGSCASLGRGA